MTDSELEHKINLIIFFTHFFVCEIKEFKLKKNLSVLIAISLFPLIALADLKKPTSYIEIGGVGMTVKDSSSPGTSWKPTAAKITLGKMVTNNLGIEFTAGTGVYGSTGNAFGTIPTTVKLGPFYGVYLRPTIPLGDSAEFFARVGYLRGRIDSATSFASGSDISGSFSYGAGLSVKISDSVSTTADYMQYANVSGTTVTGFGVGLKSDF